MSDVLAHLSTGMRSRLKSSLRLAVASLGGLLPHRPSSHPRVLTYHGVCADPEDEWSVTPAQLRAHMRFLARHHHPVSLARMVQWVRGEGTLPERAVAVTFDDGFLDVLESAAPILDEFGIPGTVFVAPALLTRGAAGADAAFRVTRPLMNWSHARRLVNAGWIVGSHTASHPVLSSLSDEAARSELVTSRESLQQRLGIAADLIAYPYGTPRTVSERDRRLAREAGYQAAFMSITGPLRQDHDLHALPRSKVLGGDPFFTVRATLCGSMDAWSRVERSH